MAKIHSGVAGSACQTCGIPDSCTLEATIEFGEQKGVYRQEAFNKKFSHLVEFKPANNISKPVKLLLSSISKSCISKNQDCPVGYVFDENGRVVIRFTPKQSYEGSLRYTKRCKNFDYSERNPITLLSSFLYREALLTDPRYNQIYRLSMAECDDKPFIPVFSQQYMGIELINSRIKAMNDVITVGKRHLFSSSFTLILPRSVDVDIKISFDKSVQIQSDEKRKELMKTENKKSGYKPDHSGWTKKTGKYVSNKGIKIEGSITATLGKDETKWSRELEQKFKEQTNKIKVLSDIDRGIGKINYVLQNGGSNEYPLLGCKLTYPVISIKGKGCIKRMPSQKIIPQYEFEVKGSPLFGFKITLDLLQAFAAVYKVDTVLAKVRKEAAAQEVSVKQDGRGAYAKAELNIIFDFTIIAGFGFKTDETGEWGYDKKEAKLVGSITGKTNIEVGVGFWGLSGYFKAEAMIKAEAYLGIDDTDPKKLDFILYHDGITAIASMGYAVQVGKTDKKKGKPGIGNKTATSKKSEETKLKNEKWTIYPALSKKESTWRWSLD
ncbi:MULTISPECIES: hypothetical protein [Photorhabdus]|uniref:Uncharacterized protein n=1 Tax=Photorhabdus asymbiotica TaxID=291112 RepID=A0ABX9SJG7_9GAMM|nr:hypothetical protein [Photorhabdus asymbiotica]RKS54053.1 hypothetical protein BDD30_4413 [Photorhabdus asymbiotica]